MRRLILIGSAVITIILGVNVSAQQSSEKKDVTERPSVTTQDVTDAKAKRAVSAELVRGMADSVLAFHDSALKIRTIILLGDMLWGRGVDESNGRRLFMKADALIRSVKVAKHESTSTSDKERRESTAVSPGGLRALQLLLIERASNRDSALGQQLRRDYGLEKENNTGAGSGSNYEIKEMIRLGQIADAAKSLQSRVDSLSGRQAIFSFTDLLFVMRGRDAEAADRLFVETMSRINGKANISADDVLTLGNYPFAARVLHSSRLTTPPFVTSPIKIGEVVVRADVSQERPGIPLDVKRAFLINSTQILERASYDSEEMLRRAAASYLLLPHARSFAPECVPQLLNIQKGMGNDFPQSAELDKLPLRDGRVDLTALLESINKTPPGPIRDQRLIRICRLLYTTGELEAALAVSESIDDSNGRAKIMGIILFAQGVKFLDKGDIENAQKTLNTIRTPLPRFVLRLGLARLYLQQGETASAAIQLTSALNEIREERDQAGQPYLMLAAIEMMAAFDLTAATRELREVVKALNAIPSDESTRIATFRETIKIGDVSTNFPLKLPGVRYGSLPATLKSLSSHPTEVRDILFDLKDEKVLSEGVLALAETLLA